MDLTTGNVYLSKFVFREADAVGAPANLQFVASRFVSVSVSIDPTQGIFALLVYGTWNGTPAYGYFVLYDNAINGRDRVEFSVSKLGYGLPMYSLQGVVTSGDCKLIISP